MKLEKIGKSYYLAVLGLFAVFAVSDVQAQAPVDRVSSNTDLVQPVPQELPENDPSAWANTNVARAKETYRTIQNMLDQARNDKDTIKITCLEDKLTQVQVNIGGLEDRKSALDIAIGAGDESGAEQQFTVFKIYTSKVHSLMAEAENCIGETDVVIGNSDTIVTVNEDITIEDPAVIDQDILQQVAIDQLPHASGYF